MKISRRSIIFLIALSALAGSSTHSYGESKKASEQSGETLFRDKGCSYCHGPVLQGTHKGPALNTVRKTMNAPQIKTQIENGGQKMPPFSDSLSHDEIEQLVSFLRAKHHFPPVAPITPVPEEKPLSNPEQ